MHETLRSFSGRSLIEGSACAESRFVEKAWPQKSVRHVETHRDRPAATLQHLQDIAARSTDIAGEE
jgi:hypothetical protein